MDAVEGGKGEAQGEETVGREVRVEERLKMKAEEEIETDINQEAETEEYSELVGVTVHLGLKDKVETKDIDQKTVGKEVQIEENIPNKCA